MTAKRCGVVFVVAGVLVALGLGCRGGIADTAAYQEAAQPAILGLPRLAQRAADAQFGAVGAEIKPSVVLLIQAIDTQAGYLKGLNVSASAPDPGSRTRITWRPVRLTAIRSTSSSSASSSPPCPTRSASFARPPPRTTRPRRRGWRRQASRRPEPLCEIDAQRTGEYASARFRSFPRICHPSRYA